MRSGINIDQLKLSIAQIGDSLGVAQQSLEQLHHLADHGKQAAASASIAQATVLLGEARERLEGAVDELDGQVAGPDTTVELAVSDARN